MKPFDFKHDKLTHKPNQYLICPENYCKADVHAISPIFNITASELANQWQEIPLKEPGTKLLQSNNNQFFYEQRSKIFKFPDYITVEIIAIDEHHTSIAMYSQAKYGYYDFDVNKKRVLRWLNILCKHIKA